MKRWLLGLFLLIGFSSFTYSQADTNILSTGSASFELERDLPIFQEDLTEVNERNSSSTFGLLLELFFLLIFLSVLLYIFILFIKKIGKPKMSFGSTSDFSFFTVLGEQILPDGKAIKILEIYSKIIVVGETSHSLNFLYEIKDEDTKNRVLLDYSRFQSLKKENKKNSFFSQLQEKIINTKNFQDNNSSSMGDSNNEGSQSMERFKESKERLKNL